MGFNRPVGRVVLGTIVLAIVAVLFVTPPAHAAASELRISTNADRTNHRELSGATVTGNMFVFWNGPRARSVTFIVDPWRAGLNGPSLRSVERIAPYDLAHTAPDGRAFPFDTDRLAPGRHLLLAVVRGTGGGTTFRASTFVVKREEPVPTPTPAPTPSASASAEPTPSESSSVSPTPAESPTPTVEPTASESPTASGSPTPSESPSPSGSPTPSESSTPSESPSPSESSTPSESPTPTAEPTPTVKPTPTREPSPTPTAEPKPTVAPPPPSPGPAGPTLVNADFNKQSAGPVGPGSFNAEVGDTNGDTGAYESMQYVPDGRGGMAVRTRLAAGQYIGSGGSGNGNVLFVKLAQPRDSACMSYQVRFSSGFDFSLGGKLPGLQGVAPGVSAGTPTGGGATDRGWSGRLMWLGPKAYRFAGEGGNDNMAVTYLYHPGQAGVWGDNVQWHRPFERDRWHQVKQCHVLNTVGKADGVLQAWMDGALVVDQSNVVYRTDPSVRITHFNWSIFRGGNTADWAGQNDGHVDVDDLVISGR